VCGPQSQETPLPPVLQHDKCGAPVQGKFSELQESSSISPELQTKMPGNSNALEHTLITKLFTYCDIQTYRGMCANGILIITVQWRSESEKNLLSDKWSDYSVRCSDSCECGNICVLIIFKKAPEVGRKPQVGEL